MSFWSIGFTKGDRTVLRNQSYASESTVQQPCCGVERGIALHQPLAAFCLPFTEIPSNILPALRVGLLSSQNPN